MAAWTEETVGELYLLIFANEVAETVFCLHHPFYFGLCHCLLIGMADGVTRQQFVGDAEVDGIVVRQSAHQLRLALHGLGVHVDVHVVRHVDDQRVQFVLLQFAQHAVYIKVIEL